MGRSRKNTGQDTAPTTATTTEETEEVTPAVVGDTPTDTDADSEEDEGDDPEPSTDQQVQGGNNPLAGPKAQPRTVDAPRVDAPTRRDLGGKYRCVTRVSFNGKINPPGTTLTLNDAQARFYLAAHSIKALD